jgi:hypothetical protein
MADNMSHVHCSSDCRSKLSLWVNRKDEWDLGQILVKPSASSAFFFPVSFRLQTLGPAAVWSVYDLNPHHRQTPRRTPPVILVLSRTLPQLLLHPVPLSSLGLWDVSAKWVSNAYAVYCGLSWAK